MYEATAVEQKQPRECLLSLKHHGRQPGVSQKVLIAQTVSADNCLTKSATARGKSQSTLRFARSAPDLVEQPATPTALCSTPLPGTLKTANSDSQLSKRSAAAAQRALHDSPSSRTRQQRKASQDVFPEQCQATSPFQKAAEAAVTRSTQSPQRRSANSDSARSPNEVPSPDRKRSCVSWSTHDTDSSMRRFQGAATPSTAADTASLQPRASFGSPRRKTPQSRGLSAASISKASLSQSPRLVAEPDSSPGPTEPRSLLQAGRVPSQGSQQLQVSHHTKSARASDCLQPQHQRSGVQEDLQHNSSSSNDSKQPVSASQPNTFQTFAVGRRFRQVAKVVPGQRAFLRHQPNNPKDPNALMAVSCPDAARSLQEQPAEQLLGYLPATVAASLVALVQEGAADISVTVLEAPKTPRASLPIIVQVSVICIWLSGGSAYEDGRAVCSHVCQDQAVTIAMTVLEQSRTSENAHKCAKWHYSSLVET